ncbi:hypothetical protein [Rhodoblastus sp.]|jgi:hypothetical protein|uniref:hypothetical protein n=1 Tax=Rhodoblastus sp. TaxID=1962975 RepID=UPI0025E01B27|nr:hypothetical protein [Rhodoblastus sp.]
MSATDDLKALLVSNGFREGDVPELIAAVEGAFDRTIKERPSRSALRMKAVELEKASRQFVKASREVVKALKSANDLHFFLRMADTLSKSGLDLDDGANLGLQEARKFDDKIKIKIIIKLILSNLRNVQPGLLAIAEACRTLTVDCH